MLGCNANHAWVHVQLACFNMNRPQHKKWFFGLNRYSSIQGTKNPKVWRLATDIATGSLCPWHFMSLHVKSQVFKPNASLEYQVFVHTRHRAQQHIVEADALCHSLVDELKEKQRNEHQKNIGQARHTNVQKHENQNPKNKLKMNKTCTSHPMASPLHDRSWIQSQTHASLEYQVLVHIGQM